MLATLVALMLAASPSPLEVVKAGYADVQQTASSPDATVEQLAAAVDRFVDFEELSRRALGRTWDTLTPAQRKEFTEAMRGMLRTFYAQRVLGNGNAEVKYEKELIKDNEASVSTLVKMESNRLPIEYKLYRPTRKGSWRVYDMVTDKVSLLENYRTQFDKILADKGFDGLLATVKTRRAQVERSAAASQARDKKRPSGKQ
jgi:phospholipid transport system substrate-binding protein